MDFNEADNKQAQQMGWEDVRLLQVWRRLRILMDISPPTLELPEDSNVINLSIYVRAKCLPFLRVAAYLMEATTGVPVPAEMTQPNNKTSEWSLLLGYLGLPEDPSDLISVLNNDQDDAEWFSVVLLITSWCLQARESTARRVNDALRERYGLAPETELAPTPQTEIPRLISLPKSYTGLHSLAFEYQSCLSGHSNADPCICLVCGQLACMVCYACRQYESASDSDSTAGNTSSNSDHALNGIQAHVRQFHGGYAPVLRIYACKVYMLSDQARRATTYPAPYKDVYGEADPALKRGNPLHLVEEDYERLNLLWLSHEIPSLSSSDIPFSLFNDTF
ncbi:E3 ubiquitin-protein ligase ubr2 [Cichlidogyrus casuarinus]|uniref:E3 ubiquitin-protein ligase n=1 Tax=Cichlidogyrus casuarinus TaxID=1844966 RepID=A0ABD2QMY1_9PLAT